MKAYNQRPEVKARQNANKKKSINASPYQFCQHKFKSQKSGAKARGYAWKLDKEETIAAILEQGECILSGKKFIYKTGTPRKKNLDAPSIDRINSNKFYTVKNRQFVCWAINSMKQDLPQDVFIEYCTLVAKKAGRI